MYFFIKNFCHGAVESFRVSKFLRNDPAAGYSHKYQAERSNKENNETTTKKQPETFAMRNWRSHLQHAAERVQAAENTAAQTTRAAEQAVQDARTTAVWAVAHSQIDANARVAAAEQNVNSTIAAAEQKVSAPNRVQPGADREMSGNSALRVAFTASPWAD